MRFAEIPGQEYLKSTLIGAVKRNHVAHAQLFCGVSGGAALPMAVAYATYLLCQDKQENDACGNCDACKKMDRLTHPDFHVFSPKSGDKKDAEDAEREKAEKMKLWRSLFLENPYMQLEDWVSLADGENKLFQIGKDVARHIIRTVSLKAFSGGHKIILIWYPELMNGAAANALLKTLEEPPAGTIYLMVGYQYEQILPTILSRTQLVMVPPYNQDEIVDWLLKNLSIDEEHARQAAQFAEGSIALAKKEAEDVEKREFTIFQEWMRRCFRYQFAELMIMSDDFFALTKQQRIQFMKFSLMVIRNCMLNFHSAGMMQFTDEEKKFYENFSKAVSLSKMEKIVEKLNNSVGHLERFANPKMLFFALSADISVLLNSKNSEN